MTEITPNKYPDQVVDNSNNVKRRKRYVNTTEFATIVNIRMTTNENNISQQFYFNTNTTDAEDDYIYTNGNVNTTTNRDEQIYTAETFTMKPSSFFENFTSVSSYDVDITTSIAVSKNVMKYLRETLGKKSSVFLSYPYFPLKTRSFHC